MKKVCNAQKPAHAGVEMQGPENDVTPAGTKRPNLWMVYMNTLSEIHCSFLL
jgi:hypothetical protein